MPFHIRPFLTLPLALITLLVLSSIPAYAEWEQVGKTDNGMTIYFDPDSIRRKEDLAKMWVLSDYNLVQRSEGTSFLYLSIRSQQQFDCVEERTRWLTAAYFSGNMENGKVVFNKTGESKWKPVPPRTVAHALWEVACGKP